MVNNVVNKVGFDKEVFSSTIDIHWNITTNKINLSSILMDSKKISKDLIKLIDLIKDKTLQNILDYDFYKNFTFEDILSLYILNIEYVLKGKKTYENDEMVFIGKIKFSYRDLNTSSILNNLDLMEVLREFSEETFIKIDKEKNKICLIGSMVEEKATEKQRSLEITNEEFLDTIQNKEEYLQYEQETLEEKNVKSEIMLISALNSKDRVRLKLKKRDNKLIGVLKDITEEKMKEDLFKRLVSYDNVTGFKTKEEMINNINIKLKENTNRHSLILLDLDDFKFINESAGYEAGDYILREIGVKLTKALYCDDYICRYNGDEFIIFIEKVESKEALEEILNRIMRVFYKPISYKNKEVYVNASAGVVVSPDNGLEFYTLLKHADGALSSAKKNGKGNYVFFDYSISKEFNRFYEVQRCLRTAIEKKELYVLFQPKVFTESKIVNGFEALLRWESTELGNVSPGELIPIAEMTRLILPIGTFVLEEVFKKISELIKLGYKDFKIAINLSELQLRYNTILSDLKRLKEKYNIDLRYIEIEITESILMKSFEKNIRTLKEIKDLGATIALDDFGTGYSSLNYLTKLPIDVLKIDRSFIMDLDKNPKSRCIVENIINLSHQLGINVVAEGVEDKEQLDYLGKMLCDVIQGYYFSKPIAFEKIIKMIGKEIQKGC